LLTAPVLAAPLPSREIAAAALVGMFTAISLQHLLFFGLRRRGAENLWFGLLCLSIGFLSLLYSRPLYSAVLPALDRSRALVLAEVGAALTTAMLVRALFSFRFRWWETAVVTAFALSLPAILVVPVPAVAAVHQAVDVVLAA
jgi:Na+-translocating ferredoxin:NAD+ oxidoreductase RnfD subunit